MEKFFVQQENGTILDLFEYSTLCVRKHSTDKLDDKYDVVVYKNNDIIPLVLGQFQTRDAAQWAVDQIMILLEKNGIGFSFSFCQNRIPYEYNVIRNEDD